MNRAKTHPRPGRCDCPRESTIPGTNRASESASARKKRAARTRIRQGGANEESAFGGSGGIASLGFEALERRSRGRRGGVRGRWRRRGGGGEGEGTPAGDVEETSVNQGGKVVSRLRMRV